jgi:hypothetical protein
MKLEQKLRNSKTKDKEALFQQWKELKQKQKEQNWYNFLAQ